VQSQGQGSLRLVLDGLVADSVTSEPLSHSVKTLLLDRIVRGEYQPGERIVESRLARELNISQSPVREALRDLAAIGLIEIASRRGARVRRPTPKELRDVSQVRSEIDALAARLAAENLDDEAADKLRSTHERMAACHGAGDYVQMSRADAEFHQLIVDASGSDAVARVFAQLEPFARTFITFTSPRVELERILQQHAGSLEALILRDPDLAAERARSHQMNVREAFFDTESMIGSSDA